MVAFRSSSAEGNECNELRKRYLIPKAIPPKIIWVSLSQGNVDPNTKLVLRLDENPTGSREWRFQF